MCADDHRGDDEHKDVFLEGDSEQFDTGPERYLEDAYFEGVPVPDVREGVQNEDGAGGGPERVGVQQQRQRDSPPHNFRHEVCVSAEDRNIGEHIRSREAGR